MSVDTGAVASAVPAESSPVPAGDPLAPVRFAILDSARRYADELLAAADEEARAETEAASRRAEALRAQARAEGEAGAEALVTAELTTAHRKARMLVLAARRAAYEELRARVRAGLPGLRDDPGYALFLDDARRRARAALGEAADLEEHPSGGVVATAGPRTATYTLEALADRVLDEMGAEIEGLWAS